MSVRLTETIILASGAKVIEDEDTDGNQEQGNCYEEFHSTDGVHRLILPGANR